jgi:hypothetical protein
MGTLIRPGQIVIGSVKFICDNSVAIMLASSRGLTMSIFHHTERDYDIKATIKYL